MQNNTESRKILLGLTTTPGSDWREKIKETFLYNIQEAALFPTALPLKERKELYQLLEKSPVKSIPHVHLRNDMELWELDYLAEKFAVKVFNIHPKSSGYPFFNDYSKYFSKIFVENQETLPSEEELEMYAGLCVDFSHWEDFAILKEPVYFDFAEKMKKHKVGCAHISAVKKETFLDPDPKLGERLTYASHKLEEFNELDYVRKYKEYLPDIISIELENSFKEQLEAKKYLENIINK